MRYFIHTKNVCDVAQNVYTTTTTTTTMKLNEGKEKKRKANNECRKSGSDRKSAEKTHQS